MSPDRIHARRIDPGQLGTEGTTISGPSRLGGPPQVNSGEEPSSVFTPRLRDGIDLEGPITVIEPTSRKHRKEYWGTLIPHEDFAWNGFADHHQIGYYIGNGKAADVYLSYQEETHEYITVVEVWGPHDRNTHWYAGIVPAEKPMGETHGEETEELWRKITEIGTGPHRINASDIHGFITREVEARHPEWKPEEVDPIKRLPPRDQWAECVTPGSNFKDGQDDIVLVPFTASEVEAIQSARDIHAGLFEKAMRSSGIEREFYLKYKPPWANGLSDRVKAIDKLRQVVDTASDWMQKYPLKSDTRDVLQGVHDSLMPFLPPSNTK